MINNHKDYDLIEDLRLSLEKGRLTDSKKKILRCLLDSSRNSNKESIDNDKLICLDIKDDTSKPPVQENNSKADQNGRNEQTQLEIPLMSGNEENRNAMIYQEEEKIDKDSDINLEEKGTEKKGTKKKIWTKKSKIKVVLTAMEEGNNSEAARIYKIHESTVRKFISEMKNEKEVLDFKKKTKKKKRSGRKSKFEKIEEKVYEWILEQRNKKLIVRLKDIKEKALSFKTEENFCASNGWFANFKKRYKISHRSPTHVMSTFTDKCIDAMAEYLKELMKERFEIERCSFLHSKKSILFINFDEVPIFFDISSSRTYDLKGKKEITVKSNKDQKLRTTVMLGITSDGSRLPPLIIFKSRNKNPPPNQFPLQALVFHNRVGWITEFIFKFWLQQVIFNIDFEKTGVIPYLIYDRCPVHIKSTVQEIIQEKKILHRLIPSGCTGFIQPIDTHVGKPFKDHLRTKHLYWFQHIGNTKDNLTPEGNIKAPASELVIQWILESFDELGRDSLVNSFKHCGITHSLDGSEDNMINSRIKDKDQISAVLRENFFNMPEDPNIDEYSEIREEFLENDIEATYEPTEDSDNSSSTDSSDEEAGIDREKNNQRPQDNIDLDLIKQAEEEKMVINTSKVRINSNKSKYVSF